MDESPRTSYAKLEYPRESFVEEDIEPGELNQAAQIPEHLAPKTCESCGQVLPADYSPPQNEAWSTGILDCTKDWESCRMGLFCPCVLFGRNVERVNQTPWTGPCICHAVCVEGGAATAIGALIYFHFQQLVIPFIFWWLCGLYMAGPRSELQRKYRLESQPCDPAIVHCLLHCCALCQEHREMQARLLDDIEMKTVSEPPPMQSMEAPTSPVRASRPAE
eukprot:TRINITY_DN2632_c0_g2_i1.p1 TRINITY_DN2632_c0_g2~~TRINITY_DN2632_c0_g2_i1.p1  ORF type:complete len:220 (-),score=18.44 TRINITY_DN2632_c0_g2_i1:486-1145(-)